MSLERLYQTCLTSAKCSWLNGLTRAHEQIASKAATPSSQPGRARSLKRYVLNRDGWKRQNCGTSANLQVHHLVYRSQLGPDESTNLISLCARCHRRRHNNLFHKRNIGYCVKDSSGKIYL